MLMDVWLFMMVRTKGDDGGDDDGGARKPAVLEMTSLEMRGENEVITRLE